MNFGKWCWQLFVKWYTNYVNKWANENLKDYLEVKIMADAPKKKVLTAEEKAARFEAEKTSQGGCRISRNSETTWNWKKIFDPPMNGGSIDIMTFIFVALDILLAIFAQLP